MKINITIWNSKKTKTMTNQSISMKIQQTLCESQSKITNRLTINENRRQPTTSEYIKTNQLKLHRMNENKRNPMHVHDPMNIGPDEVPTKRKQVSQRKAKPSSDGVYENHMEINRTIWNPKKTNTISNQTISMKIQQKRRC